LTEFDGDDDAVQALLTVVGKPTFEHRVAQLRQDRIAAAARTEAENAYLEKGFTILAQRPQWRDTTTVSLHYLRTADGQDATEAAVTDPVHWAVLMTEETVLARAWARAPPMRRGERSEWTTLDYSRSSSRVKATAEIRPR
jgi:ParB family chromosome partitioning protein